MNLHYVAELFVCQLQLRAPQHLSEQIHFGAEIHVVLEQLLVFIGSEDQQIPEIGLNGFHVYSFGCH